MSNLQQNIRSLADQFVQGILTALTSASLTELSSMGGAKPARAAAPAAEAAPAAARPGRAKGRGRPARRAETPAAAPAKAAARGGKRGGRRVRRSSEDVAGLAVKVAEYVRSSGGNVAVSDIATALGVSTSDITRPVAIALHEGKVTKTGEKRLTRYFPPEGGAGGKKGKKK